MKDGAKDPNAGLVVDLSSPDAFANEAFRQMDAALADVKRERVRQDLKWGFFRDHPDDTGEKSRSRLADENDLEAARVACKVRPSWRNILHEEVCEVYVAPDEENLLEELAQVAAVASAWREAILRRIDERETGRKIERRKLPWWKRWFFRGAP